MHGDNLNAFKTFETGLENLEQRPDQHLNMRYGKISARKGQFEKRKMTMPQSREDNFSMINSAQTPLVQNTGA